MTEKLPSTANVELVDIKPHVAELADAAVAAMVELGVNRASVPRLVALAYDGKPKRLPVEDFKGFKQALATDSRLKPRSRGQFELDADLETQQMQIERQQRNVEDDEQRGMSPYELTRRLVAISNDSDVKRMRREAARRQGGGHPSGKRKASRGEGQAFFGDTTSQTKKKYQGKKHR